MTALGNVSTDMEVAEPFFSLATNSPAWPDISTGMPGGSGYTPPTAVDCEIVIINDAATEVLTL